MVSQSLTHPDVISPKGSVRTSRNEQICVWVQCQEARIIASADDNLSVTA